MMRFALVLRVCTSGLLLYGQPGGAATARICMHKHEIEKWADASAKR